MATPLLDRNQSIPYELELRDTIDACLYRLDQLEAAAKECLDLDTKLQSDPELDPEVLRSKGQSQTRIFDHLDAFLAAYARVSLLIFPVGGDPFTKKRGATMQHCLNLNPNSPLDDRALRDSWMHHDERLDKNVAANQQAGGQLFKRSAEVTAANKKGFLRIIEIDTLLVHYHDRNGTSQVADLRQLRATLETLDKVRVKAFQELAI
jgi:hypothetical protein